MKFKGKRGDFICVKCPDTQPPILAIRALRVFILICHEEPEIAPIGPYGGRCKQRKLCLQITLSHAWLALQTTVPSEFASGPV